MARFGQALKPSKPPQQLSKASEPHNPPQQLSQASHLLCHDGTSLGPTSCFYWASKLLHGTFWASLKTLKTSAAAFEGLRTSQPSATAFTGVPLALPWYIPRPHKLFLLGFETAMWQVFGRPSNFQNLRSSFRRPQHLTTLRNSIRPWYLPRPHKLFLLGFETATWHVLGRPENPQNLRSSFRRPQHLTTLRSSFRRRPACFGHGTSLGATKCFYWASKLPRGTFWASLKTLKTSAATFQGP